MAHRSELACSALLLTLLAPFARPMQDKKPAPPPKKADVVYPTFEPFTSSRMFEVMVGDPAEIDFKKQREELAKMAEIQKQAKEAGEKFGGEKPKGPNALLTPEIEPVARAAYPLIPAAMIKLAPLWKASEWTAEQLNAAKDVAAFVASLPQGPTLAFVEGKHAQNHDGLAKLVGWFRAEVARPEKYAAMIATMDEGPFAGLPYETKELLTPTQKQKLGEEIELRLCKTDRPKEPFVLQAVRKEKLLWSRVVSGGPDESVVHVELRGEPRKVDEYGWMIFMDVQWSQGEESAYLYLDHDGGMLFYFMSW